MARIELGKERAGDQREVSPPSIFSGFRRDILNAEPMDLGSSTERILESAFRAGSP